MHCRRCRFHVSSLLIIAAALTAACRADNERTLERLGSSKADSASDSAAGDLRMRDSTRHASSDLRVRVRDRDALDTDSLWAARGDGGAGENESDGGPPPWALGRGKHKHGRGHGHKDD